MGVDQQIQLGIERDRSGIKIRGQLHDFTSGLKSLPSIMKSCSWFSLTLAPTGLPWKVVHYAFRNVAGHGLGGVVPRHSHGDLGRSGAVGSVGDGIGNVAGDGS